MRKLTLALDALPSLREVTHSDIDVAAAATLAELAGVDAIRLGVTDDLKPVTERDVLETRRAARVLELRMPPSQTLLKLALQARPNRVVLAMPGRDGRSPSWPPPLPLSASPARNVRSASRADSTTELRWFACQPRANAFAKFHGAGIIVFV